MKIKSNYANRAKEHSPKITSRSPQKEKPHEQKRVPRIYTKNMNSMQDAAALMLRLESVDLACLAYIDIFRASAKSQVMSSVCVCV